MLTVRVQDAAVAAAAVLNLVDPGMTGIGGDAFCLFYEAETRNVHAINGSGRSAARATLDDICRDLNIGNRDSGSIPNTSIYSVTVPGAAAAWLDIIERYGSGKMTVSQVLDPAIRMAEDGCPISEISSYTVSETPWHIPPCCGLLMTKDESSGSGQNLS